MGKGKRIRANRSREDILVKREMMVKQVELLKKKMGLKWHEKLKIRFWYYTCRLKVQSISRSVYDSYLTHEPKWFRRIVYMNYAEGKLWRNFSDFHGNMITKCAIMDNDWTKYIDYDGNIVGDKK